MSTEVAKLGARITKIVGCATCGMGIAIDAVAERYHQERHDWRYPRSDCAVSKDGPTEKQGRAIAELLAALPASVGGPAPSGPAVPDPRLPRERDDSEPLPF